jgi:hypothetical protein
VFTPEVQVQDDCAGQVTAVEVQVPPLCTHAPALHVKLPVPVVFAAVLAIEADVAP